MFSKIIFRKIDKSLHCILKFLYFWDFDASDGNFIGSSSINRVSYVSILSLKKEINILRTRMYVHLYLYYIPRTIFDDIFVFLYFFSHCLQYFTRFYCTDPAFIAKLSVGEGIS